LPGLRLIREAYFPVATPPAGCYMQLYFLRAYAKKGYPTNGTPLLVSAHPIHLVLKYTK